MNPRDFLADDYGIEQSNKIAPRDFLEENKMPNESLAGSLVKAPFRIGQDVAKAGMTALKNIPGYYQSAQSEVPGLFNTLMQHPMHAGGQALAGLGELGQSAFNFPHDVANYASNRLNLLPQNINEKIQMGRMPANTQEQINQTFGEPQYPGEKLLRGINRNALNLMGAKGIASALNPLNLTHTSIAKNVLNEAANMQKKYSKSYGNLWNEAKQKGFENLAHVPYKIDINNLSKYTPTNRLENLQDFIKNPNNESAHFAKSELLGLQRELKRKTTLTGGEKKQFNAVNDAIDVLKDNMLKDNSGKVNNGMMQKYEKMQKSFKNEALPYRVKAIKKFQAGESTPSELVNSLSKGVFYAKRGSAHPSLMIRKNILPLLGGAAGIGSLPYIYNLLGNNASRQENR